MTNTLNKIMHDGTEYDFPEWFTPWNTWTTGNVLTKKAWGYEWAAPSGWDVVVSSDSDNVLTTWAALRAWDETDYGNLSSYDSNTIYFTY